MSAPRRHLPVVGADAPLPRPSRRHFIAAAGGLGALALGFWPRAAEARVHPPGALPPGDFERACIRCFRCAEVCPTKAIRFDSALAPRASDVPWLDLSDRACILCMRCTEVCPTDALEAIDPDPEVVQAKVHMGRPVLDRDLCLNWNGKGNCRLCWYACPYADEAIVLEGPRLGPVVRPEACPGCGLCEEACPREASAIRVAPT